MNIRHRMMQIVSRRLSHGETGIEMQAGYPLVRLSVHTTAANTARYHWKAGETTVALFTPGSTSNAIRPMSLGDR